MEPRYQMQFSVIFKTLVGKEILPICRDAVGIFDSLSRLDLLMVTERGQLTIVPEFDVHWVQYTPCFVLK